MLFVIAPLGAAATLFIMTGLEYGTWVRLLIWMAAGVALYFVYGMHNSKLGKVAKAK